ncbi:MAG: hypothetical protein AAF391_10120 [Bacteroidota bacterium]
MDKNKVLGTETNGRITMFHFDHDDWQWGWSNFGSQAVGIYPYRNHLRVGDLDADGKDEVLALNSPATVFHFDQGDWQRGWTNSAQSSFGGWGYPLHPTDELLIGDIDTHDSMDELMFIQNRSNAGWATTMDFADNKPNWRWSTYADPPLIDDWPLAPYNGSNTGYLLVKATNNKPKYLLARRKFCSTHYHMKMYTGSNVINFQNKRSEQVTWTVGSTSEEATNIDLTFQGTPNFLADGGEGIVDLGPIFQNWQDSGGSGENIRVLDGTKVQILSLPATIMGIPMKVNEEQPVHLTVQAFEPMPHEGTFYEYDLDLTQIVDGEAVEELNFTIVTRAQDSDTDDDGIPDVDDDDDDNDGIPDDEDVDPVESNRVVVQPVVEQPVVEQPVVEQSFSIYLPTIMR